MATINMSVKHGQGMDVARANFEKGISAAQAQYGKYIKTVEWSDDRASARLSGSGFAVDLKLDEESVHASGQVPFFVKMMEGSIRKFVEKTVKPG